MTSAVYYTSGLRQRFAGNQPSTGRGINPWQCSPHKCSRHSLGTLLLWVCASTFAASLGLSSCLISCFATAHRNRNVMTRSFFRAKKFTLTSELIYPLMLLKAAHVWNMFTRPAWHMFTHCLRHLSGPDARDVRSDGKSLFRRNHLRALLEVTRRPG